VTSRVDIEGELTAIALLKAIYTDDRVASWALIAALGESLATEVSATRPPDPLTAFSRFMDRAEITAGLASLCDRLLTGMHMLVEREQPSTDDKVEVLDDIQRVLVRQLAEPDDNP
jgi:hypothetical protein